MGRQHLTWSRSLEQPDGSDAAQAEDRLLGRVQSQDTRLQLAEAQVEDLHERLRKARYETKALREEAKIGANARLALKAQLAAERGRNNQLEQRLLRWSAEEAEAQQQLQEVVERAKQEMLPPNVRQAHPCALYRGKRRKRRRPRRASVEAKGTKGWCQSVGPRLSVLGYKRTVARVLVEGVNRVTSNRWYQRRCGARSHAPQFGPEMALLTDAVPLPTVYPCRWRSRVTSRLPRPLTQASCTWTGRSPWRSPRPGLCPSPMTPPPPSWRSNPPRNPAMTIAVSAPLINAVSLSSRHTPLTTTAGGSGSNG